MSVQAAKNKFCPYGVCLLLLLIPFLSITESIHHHTNRIMVFNVTRNNTTNAYDTTLLKLNESLANQTSSFRSFLDTSSVDSNSLSTNYSAYNQSCYQCLYEHQLENAIYKILNKDNFTIAKPNDTCSQCLLVKEFSNKTQSVGCMCGLYTTQSPSTLDLPLRTKLFQNVTCHELVPFEEACKKVCILGTLSYNELEASTLCYHMGSGNNIKAYVESKLCKEDTEWVFTGLASSTPICCENGNHVECQK